MYRIPDKVTDALLAGKQAALLQVQLPHLFRVDTEFFDQVTLHAAEFGIDNLERFLYLVRTDRSQRFVLRIRFEQEVVFTFHTSIR